MGGKGRKRRHLAPRLEGALKGAPLVSGTRPLLELSWPMGGARTGRASRLPVALFISTVIQVANARSET